MSAGPRGLAIGAYVLALQLSPSRAAADPKVAHATPASAPPRVDVTLVGSAASEEAVQGRILSWFQAQRTAATATRTDALDSTAVLAPSDDPGIRVWVVLTDATVAHVFFTVEEPHHGRRYLVSDVLLTGGLDEVGVEQLAQVVYLSASALWAGNVESTRQEVEEGLRRREADARPPPPPAAPTLPPPSTVLPPRPVAPPAPEGRVAVTVGSAYTLRAQGDEGLSQAVGSAVGVLWRRRFTEVGARLRADVFVPHEQPAGADVKVELGGLDVQLGLAVARRAAPRVACG